MAWNRDDGFFPRSRPRAARGGIRAQSQRGAFGQSWWAKRWISVLEGLNLGGRLSRGRSYARRGQVVEIAIEEGRVVARVQGSRPQPYAVTIKVKVLSAAAWKTLAAALAREARFVARLLAGQMPEDIEQAFEATGLSLFPGQRGDLATECSCPDWSNPCKHIAAVYYLLGEEFDRDPFLIFKLRGMGREDLLRRLGPARSRSAAPVGEDEAAPPPEPLRTDVSAFWLGAELPLDLFGEVQVPATAAAHLRRLGALPFWRGEEPLLAAIEAVYAQASQRGLDVFLGTEPSS